VWRMLGVGWLLLPMAALGACGGESSAAKKGPTLPRLETLEKLAARECACRMAGRDSRALANEFERLTAELDAEGWGTASFPLSYESLCLRKLGENACVMIQANVVASPGEFACSESQMDELEAVFTRSFPSGSSDPSAADAALKVRLQGMREELKAEISQSECDRI